MSCFPTKIARLEQGADSTQRQVIADFRAAMRRPHPLRDAPDIDPLEAVLMQARSRLASELASRSGQLPGTDPGTWREAVPPAVVAGSPAGSSAGERFDLPGSWPAAPLIDFSPPPMEDEADDIDYDLSDLPAADLIDFPSLPGTPCADASCAQAETGSSQAHDATWLHAALQHEPPEQRERLINEVAMLDGQLQSLALGHVDDLLRNDPMFLMDFDGGKFAATVLHLLALLPLP